MVTQLSAEPRWVVRCALVVSIAVGTLMAPMLGSTAAQDAGTTQPAHAADAKIFEAQQLLSFVLDRLKSRFAYPELLDQPDFVKKADALRETIAAAKSLAEAAPQINALLGELKISHTALYTPDAIEYPILLDAIGSGDGIAGLIERKYWGNLPSLETICI